MPSKFRDPDQERIRALDYRARGRENPLTLGEARRICTYDPGTGAFASSLCVRKSKKGYLNLVVRGCEYGVHRVAWLMTHGRWPSDQLDHIDCDKSNNRMANLREANSAENSRNTKVRVDNLAGAKGVGLHHGKYRARIFVNGSSVWLGYFSTEIEAKAAYAKAAEKHFKSFARSE
jgi:HNH endonuclease